jgi:ABC-type Mn2+/Zn2+ transport system permease subunit
MLLLSAAIAVVGSLAGILLSFHGGLTSGPAIVLCLGGVFIASALISPRHGIIRVLRDNRGRAAGE